MIFWIFHCGFLSVQKCGLRSTYQCGLTSCDKNYNRHDIKNIKLINSTIKGTHLYN